MNLFLPLCTFLFSLSVSNANAPSLRPPPEYAGSEKLLADELNQRLTRLTDAQEWKKFVEAENKLFSEPNPSSDVTVKIDRHEVKVDGETFATGLVHRQTYIKAPFKRVREILTSPQLFEALYGLSASTSAEGQDPEHFQARILKKVPLIQDQDFVLDYKAKTEGEIWFQRVRQVYEEKPFAIRDNLVAVTPSGSDGVVFREVGYVYPLKWWVRAMGAEMRSIMKVELLSITKSLKCAAESDITPVTVELAKKCFESSKK